MQLLRRNKQVITEMLLSYVPIEQFSIKRYHAPITGLQATV